MKTPTLIVQSEEDHRTPMADAEQWFMALKKQGVPVELVRYPALDPRALPHAASRGSWWTGWAGCGSGSAIG